MSETTMPYNWHRRQAGDLFECLGEEESTRACQRLAIDVKVAPVEIARCCRRSDAAVERSARDETSAYSIHSKTFKYCLYYQT